MEGLYKVTMAEMTELRPEVIAQGIRQVITGQGAPCGDIKVESVEEEAPKKSRIEKCVVKFRQEDKTPYLFGPGGDMHVMLDGYAVVPKEEYMHRKKKLAVAAELVNKLAATLPENKK